MNFYKTLFAQRTGLGDNWYETMFARATGFKYDTLTNVPIASFVAKAGKVKSLAVGIEPKQSGSGDPSPSNIRPISGWDEVEVVRTGVNIWDEEWELGIFNTTTGINSPSSTSIRAKNFIPIKPSTKYRYCTEINVWVIFYDKDKNAIPSGANTSWYNTSGNSVALGINDVREFVTPADAYYMRFYCQAAYGTTYNHDISINYPRTDDTYHAYQGSSYSITFKDSEDNPITVYGGEVDVISGEGKATMGMVDLGTLDWAYNGGAGHLYFNSQVAFTQAKAPETASTLPNILCTKYATSLYVPIYQNTVDNAINIFTNGYIYLRDSAYTDAVSLKASLSGVMLCYELATPTDFTTTPEQISTQLGSNNIWADSGEVVEVTFRI